MRVGLVYNAATGDRTWHDGTVLDGGIPLAFWRDDVVNANRSSVSVRDGLLKARHNHAPFGYLCEVDDPCKLCPRLLSSQDPDVPQS